MIDTSHSEGRRRVLAGRPCMSHIPGGWCPAAVPRPALGAGVRPCAEAPPCRRGEGQPAPGPALRATPPDARSRPPARPRASVSPRPHPARGGGLRARSSWAQQQAATSRTAGEEANSGRQEAVEDSRTWIRQVAQGMRRAHLAQLRDGDPCPCRDTGDCASGCPGDPIAQPMQHKAELNIDGRSAQLDHLVPFAVGGRRGRVSRFEDYKFTLACCNLGGGDGTRGPNVETRSRRRARRGGRDGSPFEPGRPAPQPAPPPALYPISDATMPADLPRFPDQNPWLSSGGATGGPKN
jgi:hypothetical protein